MKIGLLKWDFCERWYFENTIFVKNGFPKCEFYEKCDFENAIFFLLKCDFEIKILIKCDFENVNYAKNSILKMWILLDFEVWIF